MLQFLLLLLFEFGQPFSFPGIQSKSYEYGEKIQVYVNEMTSQTNQIPYDYYMLEYCTPSEGIENKYENIGSLMLGTKTQNSPYNVYMGINESCTFICQVDLDDYDVNNFKWFIEHNYRVNMLIDGLPLIQQSQYAIQLGIPIGYKESDEEYLIINHITFEIEIYSNGNYSQINKVSAIPKSMSQNQKEDGTYVAACMDYQNDDSDFITQYPQYLNKGKLIFTYDTVYVNSTTKSDRWNVYKKLGQEEAQWLSLSLTFTITLLLTGIVALFLRLIIKRDILKFERLPNNQDDNFDEMGWKQVSRDVFRPPINKMALSILIGTGVQLILLVIATLFLTCIGFVYQAHSGNLATLIIVIYVFTGSLNGYYSAKYYKYFKGEYWLICTLLSNLAFPLMALFVYLVQHIFLYFEDSSSTFSFKAAITFVALQFGIQTPLNLIGSFLGYKLESPKNACKYYAIAQYVPEQPFYLDMFYCCVIGGLISFVSVGIELGQIMSLIWKHSYYEFFVSLFLSLLLLFIICAEVSIIATYLSLVKQNHRWHWKAFFVPFSSGIYLFIYSVQYQLATLQLTRLSALLYYFGTMYLVSLSLGIVCGTIGFLASYLFVHKIYSMVKID